MFIIHREKKTFLAQHFTDYNSINMSAAKQNYNNTSAKAVVEMQPYVMQHSPAATLLMLYEFVGSCDLKNLSNPSVRMHQCLWIWTILSYYSRIEYNPMLRGNSANAKFCEMMGYLPDGTQKPIFAKFQISERGDSMLVDNINGFILNKVLTPATKGYFMEFIDSCRTCIRSNGVFPLEDMNPNTASTDSGACVPTNVLCAMIQNNYSGFRHARVSFHGLIKGTGNLADYITNGVRNNTIDTVHLANMVANLFLAMKDVSSRSGFTHNDAHLGNILVKTNDNGTDSLVLIDYGRVMFVPSMTAVKILEDVLSQRMQLELAKHFTDDYCARYKAPNYNKFLMSTSNMRHVGLKNVLLGWVDATSPDDEQIKSKEYFKSIAYMFDIMTISMNIVKILNDLDSVGDILDDIVFMVEGDTAKDDTVCVISPHFLYGAYKTSALYKSPYKFLIPGIFWYSLIIEFLEVLSNTQGKTTTDVNERLFFDDLRHCVNYEDGWFRVYSDNLAHMGLMHTFYQLLNIPDNYWPIMMLVINGNKERLQDLQDSCFGTNFEHSGGKSKKMNKKLASKHSHKSSRSLKKMQIEKVDASRFKGFLGTKMLGGGMSQSSVSDVYDVDKASLVNRTDPPIQYKFTSIINPTDIWTDLESFERLLITK
jgi:hypothetical protein